MKKKTSLIILLLAALSAIMPYVTAAQVSEPAGTVFPEADRLVAKKVLTLLFQEKSKAIQAGRTLSTSEMMLMAAKQLSGTPYVGGTLDSDWKGESLRISLTRTDCILFVETCLCLAQTVQSASRPEDASVERFASNVAAARYRTAAPPYAYSDRIHYTTEWIRLKEGKLLEDVTVALGGVELDHPIFYMSTFSEKYPLLSDTALNPDAKADVARIRKVEAELNRKPMTAITKDKLASALKEVRSGDIICFVSSVEGLDIAHVAIAVQKDGRTCFIHASMNEGKVVTDVKTIFEYVSSRRNLSGIKVVRPL